MINKPIGIKILSVNGDFVNFIYRSSNTRLRMPKDLFKKEVKNKK